MPGSNGIPFWRQNVEFALEEYVVEFRMPTIHETVEAQGLYEDPRRQSEPAQWLREVCEFVGRFFIKVRTKETGQEIEGGQDLLSTAAFYLNAGAALEALFFRPGYHLAFGRAGLDRLTTRSRARLAEAERPEQGQEVQGLSDDVPGPDVG